MSSTSRSAPGIGDNQLLEAIFENTPILIGYLDCEFNFIRVNRAYAEADDREPSFFPGKNHFDLYPNEENERIFRLVVEIGEPYFVQARQFVYENNPERGVTWWDWNLAPVKDDDGRVTALILILVNVTEQKLAEKALCESESIYRRTIENASGVPYQLDLASGKYVLVGAAIEDLVGIPQEEFSPQAYSEMILEQVTTDPDGPEDHAAYDLAFWQGDVVQYRADTRIQTPSGDIKWISDYAVPIHDNSGQVVGSLGILLDITERMRAEERARFLSLISEQVTDSVITTGLDFKITYVNRSFRRLYGYSDEEILGRSPGVFNAAPGSEQIQNDIYQTVSSGNVWTCEHLNRKKDGTTFLCEMMIFPLVDEQGVAFAYAGIQRDITERKKAEEALIESESRYQELFSSVMEGIGIVDENEIIKFVNPAYVKIFGENSANDMLGKNLLDYFSESRKDMIRSETDKRRTGESSQYELDITTPEGRKKHLHVSITPRFNKNHEYAGAFGTVLDITETKRLQELESRAQRLETAGQIAGQVAHDFNNLLAPLMAYPEFIKEELAEDHPALKYVAAIEKAAQQIADINQQLLTLGRRGHYNQQIMNLNDVVTQAVRQLDSPPSTLVVDTQLDDSLMNIKGGGSQILRAISNLLVNAREAMQDIGQITIKTENFYVDDVLVDYARVPRGEYVKLTITDTGCGIPDEIRARIFDPFFTTKTADKKRGSGLGISVVDAVVKDHGGYIDVSSKPGQGTSFYIYFSITRETVDLPIEDEIIGGRESILIVDDDKVQRDVSLKLLSSLGYKATEAESGEGALEMLQKQAYDLLILDMIMPGGIDGAETYERALNLNSEQKAIIVSGFAESDRVAAALKIGAGAFVKKPLTRRRLAVAVRGELDKVARPALST